MVETRLGLLPMEIEFRVSREMKSVRELGRKTDDEEESEGRNGEDLREGA